MFVFAVVLVYLLCPTNCNIVRYRCRESNAPTSVTFTPAEDRVQGRYTVEYCAVNNPNITQWSIDLFYFKDSAKCRNRQRPDLMHSVLQEEPIVHTNNCTNVCYRVDFDLIFMGCYNIKSKFVKGASKMRPHDEYITIKNNITLEMFTRNKPHVSFIPYSDEVILHWYLGLPVTDYTVDIALLNDDGRYEFASAPTNVTQNCTRVKWNEVRCRLFISLGNYQAIFRHHPLWSSLLNSQTDVSYTFNYTAVQSPELGGDTPLVWWVCGGALLATAALFAAGMARRALRTRNYHKHVLESWRRARECEVPRPIDPRPPKSNILILYAREGEHGQRAVTALKTLLQQVIGGQVLDLFSPEVLSLAAPAPSAWLRDTMLGASTRVVLLQSPATQALFATNLNQSNLNLQEPLLGRRAMYRCPQYGDQLLLLALRLISETVSEHHDYSKYYLATYNSLESDIIQQVVPFRRYVLPAAVAALLRDLTGNNTPPIPATPTTSITPTGEPDPALLKHFYDSVERFITHVSDNPDYLMEELMIM